MTCTLETVRETLFEHGYAILPNLLSTSESISMQRGMWDTLEHLTQFWSTPIHRDTPSSWKEILKLHPSHSMLLQHYHIGHAPFIWNVRQNPKCVNVFSKIWNSEDLLCSFDAAAFHMPPEITGRGSFKTTWFHVDQSYTRNEFECVQSWVTGYEVRPGDATLEVLTKSHLYHKEIADRFSLTNNADWTKLTDEQVQAYLDLGCERKRIECPRGSMVLWDSRTVHCGVEPLKDRARPNFRCVAYLCYMPKQLATSKQIQKHIDAFTQKRMTTHWPCKVKLFGKKPRLYPGDIFHETSPLPEPTITELGRRLIGW
jgi:hypothetical protein